MLALQVCDLDYVHSEQRVSAAESLDTSGTVLGVCRCVSIGNEHLVEHLPGLSERIEHHRSMDESQRHRRVSKYLVLR